MTPFQFRVREWCVRCFGTHVTFDRTERNHRFLEEALELVQALGCNRDEAHQLVDYVFSRPVGKPDQELGGVCVTLAALANANDLDIAHEQERELSRISVPEILLRIQAKQAAKPRFAPWPDGIRPMTPDEISHMPGVQAPRAWTDHRTMTHDDLARQSIQNPDAGRTCGLCQRDVPSGYKHEHGRGVCVL
jgi:hypothetical protein